MFYIINLTFHFLGVLVFLVLDFFLVYPQEALYLSGSKK